MDGGRDLAEAAGSVLPSSAVAAGFEIGMLLRCARTGSGRHERHATPSTAVEFSRAGAAARLATLVTSLGLPTRPVEYTAGGWHRYTVHRVVCTGLEDWPLSRAWHVGYQRLCGADEYRSARQRRHRADLARAAWRAAVLCGGLRRRGGPLAVRVMDTDLALILVRAARVLDAPVNLRGAGGRHVVEVAGGAADLALRQLATGSAPAALVAS